jgi:MFS transporter, DHA3 family, tetracycline resistance protein
MKKENPLRLYLNYSFITSALYSLIFTVNLLYYILVAKLDPLQLVLVGTALEASVFVFEVPTGVVADSISRRLSVIIGIFLIGIAFLINGIWPVFWVIAAAQVLWGLGHTFTSGAQQAWISDEIGEENAGSAFIQSARWDQWGGITGTIASVFIATLSIRAPILAGGCLFILLGFYLILRMDEKGFTPEPLNGQTRFQQFTGTFKEGIKMIKLRPVLISILAVGFFFGFYSEGYDRLWQAHLLAKFQIPELQWISKSGFTKEMNIVIWYAGFKILMMFLTAIATRIVEKHLRSPEMKKLVRLLLTLSGLLILCLAGFALSGNLLISLVLVLSIGIIREVTYPVYNTWVNHRLNPQVRATVLSISSQVDAVGQIAGGPFVGVIAKQISVTAGLITSSSMLSPILVFLFGQRNSTEGSNDSSSNG